jgi:hypothetical protein
MGQMQRVGVAATIITTDETGLTIVTYHQTQVVRFNPTVIVLDTGGWFTATTKARMNQVSNQFRLGYQVYQKDFQWYVNYGGKAYTFNGNVLKLRRK